MIAQKKTSAQRLRNFARNVYRRYRDYDDAVLARYFSSTAAVLDLLRAMDSETLQTFKTAFRRGEELSWALNRQC